MERSIRILDDHIANQIAAGEVVERPASVVKELVENAIDAHADYIEVTVEEGGLSSIRIRDNGSGISPADVETAFLRHATSKIATGRDLFAIRTLGFRGEALPSIAAVSKIECRSSASDDGLGRRLVIEGGRTLLAEDDSAPRGTEIIVKELFFNTPARLKYMKSIQTELGHISDYIYRLALAHPHIAFTLRHGGNTLLQSLGNGDLRQTIAAVYGTATAKAMIPVSGESIDYQLNGYISKPEFTRANRSGLTVTVNGRVIRSVQVMQALLAAYHTLLPIGRFPVAVLRLTMDPALVDVNVHPSKLEVRFSKEAELIELVRSAAFTALTGMTHIPSGAAERQKPAKPAVVQEQLELYRPYAAEETAAGAASVGPEIRRPGMPYPAAEIAGSRAGANGVAELPSGARIDERSLGTQSEPSGQPAETGRDSGANTAGGESGPHNQPAYGYPAETGRDNGASTAGGEAGQHNQPAYGYPAETGRDDGASTQGGEAGSQNQSEYGDPAEASRGDSASTAAGAEASPRNQSAYSYPAETRRDGSGAQPSHSSQPTYGYPSATPRDGGGASSPNTPGQRNQPAYGYPAASRSGGTAGSRPYAAAAPAQDAQRREAAGRWLEREAGRTRGGQPADDAAEAGGATRGPGGLPAFPLLAPIGQLHGTYIVAQNDRGLYLIDQHAAHERIHYELFYDRFGRPGEAVQPLLVPIPLEFTAAEATALVGRLDLLKQVGVELEPFGPNSYLVRSLPHWLPDGQEQEIVEEMIGWLLEERKAIDIAKLREKSAILVSCKASIKANEAMTVPAMEALLDRLGRCRQPYTCPHGRPIVVSFSTYELEKMFKRVM